MTLDQILSLDDEALQAKASRLGVAHAEELSREELISEILEALEEDTSDRAETESPPLRIIESKFQTTCSEVYLSEPDEDMRLPDSYNETRARLLLRDPFWAFAYWDLSEKDSSRAAPSGGKPQLALKLYSSAGRYAEWRECFEVLIGEEDRSWYLSIPEQGALYKVALARKHADRDETICESNEVRAPAMALLKGLRQSRGDIDELLELSGVADLGVVEEGGAS